MSDLSDRLTIRVTARFVAIGTPKEISRAFAENQVKLYLGGEHTAWHDMVASEALDIFVESIPAVASNLKAVWERVAPVLNAMRPFMPPASEALWGLSDEEEAALDKEHPSDFISGAPDHCWINGDRSSCGCPECLGGHRKGCEVWSDPDWTHSVSLCLIPRTNCLHPERHAYGQKCSNYYPTDRVEQLPSGLPQVVTVKDLDQYQPHAFNCLSQGGHASPDCLKTRPTCPHTPLHFYAERCPK